MKNDFMEFTEFNDNEGETWSFFISKKDPHIKSLIKIVELYKKLDNNENDSYNIKEISGKEVDTLLKRKSKTYYFNEYNLVKRIKDPKEIIGVKDFRDLTSLEKIEKYLYKAKCFDF